MKLKNKLQQFFFLHVKYSFGAHKDLGRVLGEH